MINSKNDPNNFFSEEKLEQAGKNLKTIRAYDNNPQYYADKFDSCGIRMEDIDQVLRLNDSGLYTVLELGCGNGRDAEYIISKVGAENYTGIDASGGLIDIARKKIPNGRFVIQDMRETDVSSETLGMVFSFASVLHVNRDDLAKILEKCHKWLKIGGILFISTKYGEYREEKTINLDDEKYYYYYAPEDIENLCPYKFFVVYRNIQDIKGQSWFEIILRKI